LPDISRGLLDRRRPVVIKIIKNNWDRVVSNRQHLINKQVLNYAKGIAKVSDLNINQVLSSKPVLKYRDKIWFRES